MAMNRKPFPHPKALKDMRKSLMYIEDAAKITLRLLEETGIRLPARLLTLGYATF